MGVLKERWVESDESGFKLSRMIKLRALQAEYAGGQDTTGLGTIIEK